MIGYRMEEWSGKKKISFFLLDTYKSQRIGKIQKVFLVKTKLKVNPGFVQVEIRDGYVRQERHIRRQRNWRADRRIKWAYRVVLQDKAGRKSKRSLIRGHGMRNNYIRFISTDPIQSVRKKRIWDLEQNWVVKTSLFYSIWPAVIAVIVNLTASRQPFGWV